jgi:outer membrane protein assembly factor BamB
MKTIGVRKALIFGILLLFVGTNFISTTTGDSNEKMNDQINERQPSPLLTIDWWPMFHHDLTHSGYSTSLAPSACHVVWTFQTDTLILSSPIVADGKVYIGSNHTYYCLNASTGKKIWECNTDGWAEGNPAIENGKLYLVSRNQDGVNKIFCVYADTGHYLWNYTDCYWPFSPVVYNGRVYFGSLDGYVRCLNALNGSFIWSFSTDSIGTSNAPAISAGKVYFGAENGKMYCVNASNGEELWNYPTNGKIMECPSMANGKVYFGSVDWKIYCLNAENGQSLWNFSTNYYVDSTPAIAYGKIFIGSRDCNLYCLNANTGQYVWSFSANDQVDSSPAVADGKVYVGSDDGRMYCLNADTGTKLWDYMTGSYVMSSPAIANAKVYIGSYDTNLYCFGGVVVANFTWTPTKPNRYQTVIFNASTSYSPDPNEYITLYEWDWDNNGLYENASTSPTMTHLWPDPGTYSVTLRVTNNINATDTVTRTFSISNQPPNPPTITGPAKGKIKVATEYNFTAVDPEGDDVHYLIDWGDSTNNSWIGPYPSGDLIAKSHIWSKKGKYTIKAKAVDTFGNSSDWGTLQVSMPLTYERPHLRFIDLLFDRFPHAFPLLRILLGY